MKEIRKYMTGLAALGLVMAVAGSSQAWQHQGTNYVALASATITGGLAQMNVTMIGGSKITWATPTAGGGWQAATQYLQIASTLTLAGSGIQTYTANSGGLWTAAASSTTAAGLVNQATGTDTLPLGWQISTGTLIAADDPNCYGVGQPAYCGSTTGRTGWAWFYYADKGGGLLPNAGTAPGSTYIQVESAGNPPKIQYADTTIPSFGAGNANGINDLFLETNFANALSGNTYLTNTLTVEAFTQ
jgi:hypothetical protein